LYDIGFDKPEGHVISKGGALFYAFYAKEWKGKIALRGLKSGISYRVTDYVNNRDFGEVTGTENIITADFENFLLLKAEPVK
jgi:alpha-galactosidase